MLPRVTPQFTFATAAGSALIGVLICLYIILQAPWFGIRLNPAPERVGVVQSVDDEARKAGVRPGDRVVAFSAPGQTPVPLKTFSLISDPDRTGSYEGLNELFIDVGSLYSATSAELTEVQLEDGRSVILQRSERTLRTLPLGSWILVATVIPLLVSAGVWSYRRHDIASRILLFAGTSFTVMGLSNLVIADRQPSLEPHLFQIAVYCNRLSVLLFFYATIALFWVYPRRFASPRMLILGFIATILVFINEVSQTVRWPGDPFAFPLVTSMLLAAGLIAMQWRYARGNPLDTATLQWSVFVLMTGTIVVTGLYFLPGLVGADPVLNLELAFGIGILSYLGLIMAVARVRLFQLGDWWLTAWIWLLGGAAVIALDLFIAYLSNVAPSNVIVISMLIMGWIYFPLRQWLWRRIFWNGTAPMEWLPKELLKGIVTAEDADSLNTNWHNLLQKVFNPLHIRPLERVTITAIGEEGLSLRVPNLGSQDGVELIYRSAGRRLFGPIDIELVESLLQMAGPAVDAKRARDKATRRERERIMRDLHDDVCSSLQTLSHRLEGDENAHMVQRAMQTLRETIYSMNRPEGCDLATALADWRYEILERLESKKIALEWSVEETLLHLTLNAAQRANLGQILREAVSNALRHAHPSHLNFSFRYSDEMLQIEMINDGNCSEPAQWSAGTGMRNMRRRSHELGGHIAWYRMKDGTGTVMELSIKLASREAETRQNLSRLDLPGMETSHAG